MIDWLMISLSILLGMVSVLAFFLNSKRIQLQNKLNTPFKHYIHKSTSTSELLVSPEAKEVSQLSSPTLGSKNSSSDFLESGRFERLFENPIQIGQGGFGEVFKATHRIEQQIYAIKRVIISLSPNETLKDHRLYREVKTLTNLEHSNIVRFYTSWIEECQIAELDSEDEESEANHHEITDFALSGVDFEWEKDESSSLLSKGSELKMKLVNDRGTRVYLYIQMVYCGKNSLKNYIEERGSLDYRQNYKIFSQILAGMEYLHSKNVIHRDLKPSNIFMPHISQIKIGDFGLARVYKGNATASYAGSTLKQSLSSLTGRIGSPFYVAPEQEKGETYNSKVDVYSLGVVLLELFSSFTTIHERHKYFKTNLRGEKKEDPGNFPGEIWSLVRSMVNEEAGKRPSIKEIENCGAFISWRKNADFGYL